MQVSIRLTVGVVAVQCACRLSLSVEPCKGSSNFLTLCCCHFCYCCCVGKQTNNECLLHFALRHRLVKLVDYLLEGESPVNKRQLISNLGQESYDCLTVQFLARANYPDILPKLNKMYKDEIGSQMGMGQ